MEFCFMRKYSLKKELAKKFNISERTLSRDVDRLRAAHLSIELDEEQKYYLVGGSSNIGFKQADINDFVQLSGIQGLYPSVKASSLKKLFISEFGDTKALFPK